MSRATSAVCGITMLTPLCGGVSGMVTALSYGGPGIAVWGWVAVAFFTINVALGMAEARRAFAFRPPAGPTRLSRRCAAAVRVGVPHRRRHGARLRLPPRGCCA